MEGAIEFSIHFVQVADQWLFGNETITTDVSTLTYICQSLAFLCHDLFAVL
jgi:hypothetical protein